MTIKNMEQLRRNRLTTFYRKLNASMVTLESDWRNAESKRLRPLSIPDVTALIKQHCMPLRDCQLDRLRPTIIQLSVTTTELVVRWHWVRAFCPRSPIRVSATIVATTGSHTNISKLRLHNGILLRIFYTTEATVFTMEIN
jgi:hypothetical protein